MTSSPVRSGRGLHSHLRGQQRPNALRPLTEARTAGRTRRRESACKRIVGSRFKGAECPTGQRQEPTPRSPSNAISRTTVGPTSSIRGLAVPQPPDQKTRNAPDSCSSYAKNCYFLLSHLILHLPNTARPFRASPCRPAASVNPPHQQAGHTNALGQMPSAGQGMIPASQGASTHEDPANSNENHCTEANILFH